MSRNLHLNLHPKRQSLNLHPRQQRLMTRTPRPQILNQMRHSLLIHGSAVTADFIHLSPAFVRARDA